MPLCIAPPKVEAGVFGFLCADVPVGPVRATFPQLDFSYGDGKCFKRDTHGHALNDDLPHVFPRIPQKRIVAVGANIRHLLAIMLEREVGNRVFPARILVNGNHGKLISARIRLYPRHLAGNIHKPVPRIYSSLPADEDLYALSQNGATIKKREISSIVDLTKRIPLSTLRKRGFKKATKSGLSIVEGNFDSDIEVYWNILTELLKEKYGSHPVHTLDEIRLLQSRFPENIRLFVAKDGQEIVAGTLVYDTGTVAKTQYIASSAQGRASGAIDMLFSTLMDDVFKSRHYMDYGTSTLMGGSNLNEGLISQKEGFGARAVVYDTYELLF